MNYNSDPSARFACIKRSLFLSCRRAEQLLVDIFLDTPAEVTPAFIMNLQTRYMNWRIRTLKKKMYPRYESVWTVTYPSRESKQD